MIFIRKSIAFTALIKTWLIDQIIINPHSFRMGSPQVFRESAIGQMQLDPKRCQKCLGTYTWF